MMNLFFLSCQIKDWYTYLNKENPPAPILCHIIAGVVSLVVLIRIFTWLQELFLKYEMKKRVFNNESITEEFDLPGLRLFGLKLGRTPDEMGRISVWVYDIEQDMFDSLYNNALSKGGMSYDEILSLIHPDDKEAYINDLYELSSGITEKMTELLRFYHNGKYELYRYNAIALKSELTDEIDVIIGTEENVSDQSGEYANFYGASLPCDSEKIAPVPTNFQPYFCPKIQA